MVSPVKSDAEGTVIPSFLIGVRNLIAGGISERKR